MYGMCVCLMRKEELNNKKQATGEDELHVQEREGERAREMNNKYDKYGLVWYGMVCMVWYPSF